MWVQKIRELIWADPEDLLANPLNFRRHPPEQRDALRASLDEIGWASPLHLNINTNHLLDGHARVEEAISAGFSPVPIITLDLTLEEEKKFLATFDPITGMAINDLGTLELLKEDLKFENVELELVVANLAGTKDEFGTEFELNTSKQSDLRAMTFMLTDMQAETILEEIAKMKRSGLVMPSEEYGNDNSNGNALYELVRLWAKRKS